MRDKKHDDFFDEKQQGPTPESELTAMVDSMELVPGADIESGSKVSGTVVSLGREHAFIDIGVKNEAMISKQEITDGEGKLTVDIGDTVEAYVVSVAPDEIVLSKSLSVRRGKLMDLIEAMQSRIPVEGRISGVNEGGFNVSIMGKNAFCPFSQIDTRYVDSPNDYLAKTFPFVISRVENHGRNIVVSRLPLLEKDILNRIGELEEGIAEKRVLQGKVTRIVDFGLFVDLGGIEGLVHVSEVSWSRTEGLEEIFTVGQEVDCIVLKVEKAQPLRNTRISLSIREACGNPWLSITDKLAVGQAVPGTITRLANFGAFVQLAIGVEGLIHISEMSWAGRVRHPSDVVSEDQEVEVTILAINEAKRSISCSLKDVSQDPWKNVPARYPVGAVVKGTVAGEKKYGFFVDLDESVTGLLPRGKVAADRKGEVKKGHTIEVRVDEVDTERRRISLSFGEHTTLEADTATRQQHPAGHERAKTSPSEFGDLLRTALEKKK